MKDLNIFEKTMIEFLSMLVGLLVFMLFVAAFTAPLALGYHLFGSAGAFVGLGIGIVIVFLWAAYTRAKQDR